MTVTDNYPDKLRKAVFNAVRIIKGSYAYNKSIGSDFSTVVYDGDDLQEQCEIAVKDAIRQIPDVRFVECVIDNVRQSSFELKVRFEYMGDIYETEVLDIIG